MSKSDCDLISDIDEKDIIDMWYAGLGEVYKSSRSNRLGIPGSQNPPRLRMIYYFVAGLSIFGQGICCLMIPFVITGRLWWLSLISVVFGGVGLTLGYKYLRVLRNLHNAVKLQIDTDRNDLIRMRTLKKAFRWGQKKGFIKTDGQGKCLFDSTG